MPNAAIHLPLDQLALGIAKEPIVEPLLLLPLHVSAGQRTTESTPREPYQRLEAVRLTLC
jgi:hypothetical protein